MLEKADDSTGEIIGLVKFSSTKRYNSLEEFRADEGRHLIPAGNFFDYKKGKRKFGWLVDDYIELEDRLPPPTKGLHDPRGFTAKHACFVPEDVYRRVVG